MRNYCYVLFLFSIQINQKLDFTSIRGLKSDRMIEIDRKTHIVDINIAFDDYENIDNAVYRKISKYSHLGFIIPFVVGALESRY